MSTRVIDVMTTNVVAVCANASFKEIAVRLREQHVSAFAVLDADDKVIGVVSEADLLPKEALETGYEGHRGPLAGLRYRTEREKATGLTAADLMTRPPVTVGPFDLVSHAAHLMYDHKITSLPVVDRGRLAGMITRTDVLGVFSRPDADIRSQIVDKVILAEFTCDPSSFSVTVHDGVVTLKGRPENPDVGHGIVNAVRHIEGVVAVDDRLAYPPADSLTAGDEHVLSNARLAEPGAAAGGTFAPGGRPEGTLLACAETLPRSRSAGSRSTGWEPISGPAPAAL